MSNATQLFLLADHIKLSLLERQRAISLNLEPNSQDAHISRSLESLREGIDKLSGTTPESDQLTNLHSQYNDLSRQFHGDNPSSTASATLTSPNDPSLARDFDSARAVPPKASPSLKKQDSRKVKSSDPNKAVRFRDDPSDDPEDHDPNRSALFPSRYHDVDSADQETPDPQVDMSNQQIHAYHSQVLAEQDDQLDRLGESIGRQRHLSMQIGDDLDGQIDLLDDVDEGVDRHQTRLDVAKRRLKGVSNSAKRNWGMTTIIILIVILVFLIVILK